MVYPRLDRRMAIWETRNIWQPASWHIMRISIRHRSIQFPSLSNLHCHNYCCTELPFPAIANGASGKDTETANATATPTATATATANSTVGWRWWPVQLNAINFNNAPAWANGPQPGATLPASLETTVRLLELCLSLWSKVQARNMVN